jgi:hypothetical protein
MKKFSAKFEDHKIPEWYDRYFKYDEVKDICQDFKVNPNCSKLEGFYNVNSHTLQVSLVELDKNDYIKMEDSE